MTSEFGENAKLIEKHIGEQLKKLRMANNLSQKRLGDRVGVSREQIQKYERGLTALTAGELHLLAQALNVPPSGFYPDLTHPIAVNDVSPGTKKLEAMLKTDSSKKIKTAMIRLLKAIEKSDNAHPAAKKEAK